MYFCKWGFKFSARESKEKSRMCRGTLGDASDINTNMQYVFFPFIGLSHWETTTVKVLLFSNIKKAQGEGEGGLDPV